jgi:hypothetical protein
MTDTRSPQRITWEPYDNRGYKGFTASNPRNDYGDNHTYWIGSLGHGTPIIADVRRKKHGWENIDVACKTMEEAKAWCEAVEATGAYR